MHDYEVIWSRESIYDVVDIVDYIEQRFGKDRADRFNDEIDAECTWKAHDGQQPD